MWRFDKMGADNVKRLAGDKTALQGSLGSARGAIQRAEKGSGFLVWRPLKPVDATKSHVFLQTFYFIFFTVVTFELISCCCFCFFFKLKSHSWFISKFGKFKFPLFFCFFCVLKLFSFILKRQDL